MSLVKVTEWQWRQEGENKARTDAYYYNPENETVIVVRGKQDPKTSSEVWAASRFWQQLQMRGRGKLLKNQQILYDHLKDIGFK